MRLDKYLKVSRLMKRRTVANEACDAGRVMINDRPAKASAEVKPGDVVLFTFDAVNASSNVIEATAYDAMGNVIYRLNEEHIWEPVE